MKRTITAVSERVEIGPAGVLKRFVVYDFMLDDLGPFTVELPKEENTAENLKKAIAEQEKILKEVQAE